MAESMIERVANVLATRRGSKAVWEEDTATARAAIEAMREPTELMQQVVAAQWGRRTWEQYREVIDAALKEQP